jgi:RNA polymerase sigma-70 factor (ECF subfamily)
LQDTRLWDRETIVRADQLLWIAAQRREPGPFQLEAAVQSAHCHRLFTGSTPWHGISQLYQQINAHFATHGSQVAGAVAFAETGDVSAGLAQLDAMDADVVKGFQPWWVARGYLLSLLGRERAADADHAYANAIGLTQQHKARAHLAKLRAAIPLRS